jgi:hypothetical protein
MPIPSNPPNPPESDLLDHALWQLDYGEDNLCIAQAGERRCVVLFTSTEGAEEFVAAHPVADLPPAHITLFSEGLDQFTQAANRASEKGLQGALIDPDPTGRIRVRVDFGSSPEPSDKA